MLRRFAATASPRVFRAAASTTAARDVVGSGTPPARATRRGNRHPTGADAQLSSFVAQGRRGAATSAATSAALPTSTLALAFDEHGAPGRVLSVRRLPLPPLGPADVLVKFLASPVNPADVNAVQGGGGRK